MRLEGDGSPVQVPGGQPSHSPLPVLPVWVCGVAGSPRGAGSDVAPGTLQRNETAFACSSPDRAPVPLLPVSGAGRPAPSPLRHLCCPHWSFQGLGHGRGGRGAGVRPPAPSASSLEAEPPCPRHWPGCFKSGTAPRRPETGGECSRIRVSEGMARSPGDSEQRGSPPWSLAA